MIRRPLFACTRSSLFSSILLIAWGCSDPAPVNTPPPFFEGNLNPNDTTDPNVVGDQDTGSGGDGSGNTDDGSQSNAEGNGEGNPNADNATGTDGNGSQDASNSGSGDASDGEGNTDEDGTATEGEGNQDPVAVEGQSAGCNGNVPDPATLDVLATIISLPPGYDGSTPFPVAFGFHGAGRTNEDFRNVDSRTAGTVLEENYVMAYMKSQGNGWDVGADYPRFNTALDQILNQLCIDTSAIFAIGHSSGAQFIAQILGDDRARETRFAAVVPVASSRYFNSPWNPVPTFSIHGLNDTSRGGDPDGAQDILQYTEANQCSGETQRVFVDGCSSFADAEIDVDPGCSEYIGCAAPVLFCQHDDPNYYNNGDPNQATNHGWPCFANREIFNFFESVR